MNHCGRKKMRKQNISVSITISFELVQLMKEHHTPLSPGESGPARCSLCVGTAPSPAAGESGPRPWEAAWTETLPADSGHTDGSSADSTCGNVLQNPAGLGTRAPEPLCSLPSWVVRKPNKNTLIYRWTDAHRYWLSSLMFSTSIFFIFFFKV